PRWSIVGFLEERPGCEPRVSVSGRGAAIGYVRFEPPSSLRTPRRPDSGRSRTGRGPPGPHPRPYLALGLGPPSIAHEHWPTPRRGPDLFADGRADPRDRQLPAR